MSSISPEFKIPNETLQQYEDRLYADFNSNFVNINRIKFNNKFIYVEAVFQDNKSKMFYHVIGLEDTNKYNYYLCTNDQSQLECASDCDYRVLSVPFYPRRAHCTYRLARCNYVYKIIDLANKQDSKVQAWSQLEYNQYNNPENITYLRYKNGLDDYLVVLKEHYSGTTLTKYEFKSAHPLTSKKKKKNLTTAFNRAKANQKNYY
jgi:hypothetical protein